MVWGQQHLIEYPVDTPGLRELEPVPSRSHLLLNHEGACSLVVELLGGPIHLQVLSVQPDQVSLGILLTWALSNVIALLHGHSCFLHCLPGCSLGLCELGHPLICHRVHI